MYTGIIRCGNPLMANWMWVCYATSLEDTILLVGLFSFSFFIENNTYRALIPLPNVEDIGDLIVFGVRQIIS